MKNISFILFLREVFLDYFDLTNVLYINRGSHKSGNFINKHMTFIWVNFCPTTRGLPLIIMPQLGNWETLTCIFIHRHIYLHTHIHTHTHTLTYAYMYIHTYIHTNTQQTYIYIFNIYLYLHIYIHQYSSTYMKYWCTHCTKTGK